jgi:hypothetical protein
MRKSTGFGIAATLLIVGTLLWATSSVSGTPDHENPRSPVIRSERMLVPELVPFISEGDRARLRDVHMPAPDYKALAMAIGYPLNMSFVTGQPDKATAEAAALKVCQQIVDHERDRVGLPRDSDCELYAVGNEVVSGRGYPPMPLPPWLVRDPLGGPRPDRARACLCRWGHDREPLIAGRMIRTAPRS